MFTLPLEPLDDEDEVLELEDDEVLEDELLEDEELAAAFRTRTELNVPLSRLVVTRMVNFPSLTSTTNGSGFHSTS